MNEWLEWARGPAFRACFLIMILGLARVVFLSGYNALSIIAASKRNGRTVPWKDVVTATMKWVVPIKNGLRYRGLFSIVSMAFHVSIIITPIFLGAHILLWERGVGIGWPAIRNMAADYLSLAAIITGILIFIMRVSTKESRALSRVQDYLLPILIVFPFATGYLAMHPLINPFDYTCTMFWHVMSGNLIFLAIPFTKLGHIALFPGTQLISELGWHLVPGAGEKVAIALGKENEPI